MSGEDEEKLRKDLSNMVNGMRFLPRPVEPPPARDEEDEYIEDDPEDDNPPEDDEPENEDRDERLRGMETEEREHQERVKELRDRLSEIGGTRVYIISNWNDWETYIETDMNEAIRLFSRFHEQATMYCLRIELNDLTPVARWNDDGFTTLRAI